MLSLNRIAIFSSRLHKLLLRNGPYVRFLGALLSERKTYSSIMKTQFVFDMFFNVLRLFSRIHASFCAKETLTTATFTFNYE